jgi:hypothetical protein
MKRVGLSWRVILWLLAIGWMPAAIEVALNYFFRIDGRFQSAILFLVYYEAVTAPLTCIVILILLYKGAKFARGLDRRSERSD